MSSAVRAGGKVTAFSCGDACDPSVVGFVSCMFSALRLDDGVATEDELTPEAF